jgi:hypothetical protein
MTTGAWAQATKATYTIEIASKAYENQTLPISKTADEFYAAYMNLIGANNCYDLQELVVISGTNVELGEFNGWNTQITIKDKGQTTLAFRGTDKTGGLLGPLYANVTISVYNPFEFTPNADYTEWTLNKMPDHDATVEYDIVRNMASNMTLNVLIDGNAVTADARLRIAKDAQSGKYAPVSPLSFSLTDATEQTTLTAAEALAAKLNPVFELKGENDTWTVVENIDAETHLPADLAVGQVYRVSLVAADDAPLYGGQLTAEYTVTLFEGYELTVPAGEYVTYYRTDDNHKIDGENTGGKLYTITAVAGETATATEIASANKEMPFLVFNGNTEAKTFLLIPTDDVINQTVYAGFKGTAEATEIAASSATQNNYAFNGKKFVWVKNALAVGANKAWLEVPTDDSTAPALTLVLDNATGLKAIDNGQLTIDNGDWYDLNGRKLQNMPTRKGVYILNGKKVVVK